MTTLVRKYNAVPELLNELFNAHLWNDTKHTNAHHEKVYVNIAETNNDYKLELAAPGYNKNAFSIKLDNNILTVAAKTETEKPKTKQYTRVEFYNNGFTRTFTMPENKIDEANIAAQYENGILFVTLPKREETKPKNRQITIS